MTQDSGLRTQDELCSYARDREYWNKYYSSLTNEISHPSNFAVTILSELESGKHILDLGCGNGRDSIYFLQNGFQVMGIDASDTAIERLTRITAGSERAEFICGDFVNDSRIYSRKYDYVYSRFTLHAITASQQNELLRNITGVMKSDGKIFIEARTLRDDLYGKGENAGDNAFIYDGHYRRFIDPEELADIMKSIGYKIISMNERNGFSKFGTSDPVLMRLTAKI